MISIDRTANRSVHDQLVEQLRYLIVSGHYKLGDTLPSTRTLAAQLEVSFHTVRKAYQTLEQQGLLEARVGSGYRVKERAPLGKAERMERGAAVVHEALQRLIGLGLEEPEIEYLFAEQTELFGTAGLGPKLVFVGRYREEADLCARQLTMLLQQPVEAATPAEVSRHQDADYVIARYADLETTRAQIPRADAMGVILYPAQPALERVTRLLPHQTLGLITRYTDAIQPLTQDLRYWTRFEGQIIAASIEAGSRHLDPFLDQTDAILYTPACRRSLYAHLESAQEAVAVAPVIARDSLDLLRERIPG
ncbi:MAG: GntR family transcriptional regulator [Bacteroidetes bacterium]|nr:GntR family transcriptional regulator [Rhodothermaceae bacterium RA]RMH58103.1 MAG: GntR family transcriptional regulator [Bacteroidota bacterium]